ncbi:protein SCAR3-like [Bidens hawaiensis]|uniref:protein SCAR3-like n=1 Tax=Bidens hawaiensis TaxID=980011 RepID=UPI00404B6565
MPLVRVEVRNEYGLGMPELYTEVNKEDPKAVLDGVAVAGFVGLLRQLGDLAEFAAEVFHGLQEQLLMTSSRSHKLVERVHNVESALPPLEQAILGQRSHLHFAYTAGSKWHTILRIEQNHFIYSDLPYCIMDSYENCYDPPRLHNLDKFDTGGPGSCFRRYSDPTYFKRSSVGPYEAHLQTVPREKKKKRSSLRHRDVTRGAPVIMHDERTNFGSSDIKEIAPPCQDLSTIQPEVDHLTSVDSRNESTQSEDNNVKELSFVSHVNQDSYLDSASLDENVDNIYLAEDSRSKSNYITWDEKLENIDSTRRPNEPIEIPCTTEKMDTEVMEDLNSRNVDHIDFDFHDEQPRPTPVVSRGQHDEVESEADSYMDALNTVESESENDLNCHTKRELKHNSNVNNKDVVNEINKEIHLDDNSMNPNALSPKSSPESHMEANGSSNIENHEDATKSDLIGTTQVACASSTSLTTPEKLESKEVETNDTNSEAVASAYESPNPSWSTSGGQSKVSNLVMFWTNGGLLGLEPSKPPDFGLPAVAGPDHVEETKTNEKQAVQHPGQPNPVNDVKSEASVAQDRDGNASSETTPGTELVVPKDDSVNSSRTFEFRNRLLENGFRKQISLVGDERLASSVKSEVPASTGIQKRYPTVTGIPFISPSSPPLEHMKISFQPIGGFETSKLKLTFPDGNNSNGESNGLMFPLFQLVPEHAMLDEFASDSDDDDDTFCRSSPYASDDCHSNASESNSEQWDCSYSSRIKDHEVDDAESVSSPFVNGIRFQQGFPDHKNYGYQSSYTEDGVQSSQHGLLFDIPDFDSMKASLTNDLEGPTQSAPPLQPVEWRGVKSSPSATMEKEDGLLEALTYGLNLTPPAPTKQDIVVETDRIMVKDKNGSSRTGNGKVGEEKDDFLQQIRRKSRNLRPISQAQPTTPAGQTSVKVTAILEKASSIRQVVGSDDGEDNWSDT